MPFSNRIRLSFELKRPQFPEEKNSFRKANGVTQTLSVVIRKVYEGNTDFWPEIWHQRFKIALAHDNVSVEGDRYLGAISQDGDYTINWPDFLDYPTGPAEFKAEVTPFDATNSNCQTCEEATQLTLVDDDAGTLDEDTDYDINAADNDTICCYPAVFSLTSFNSDYLDSATIDPDTGVISAHTGTGLTEANGVVIATYRVTCPNGGYDEADVYADIAGTVPGCLAPTNLEVTDVSTNELTYEWDAPGVGLFSYYWEIYIGSGPIGSPVQTGTLTMTSDETVTVFGLDPATEYYFQIRQDCGATDSNFVSVVTETAVESANCGSYTVTYDTGGTPGGVCFC